MSAFHKQSHGQWHGLFCVDDPGDHVNHAARSVDLCSVRTMWPCQVQLLTGVLGAQGDVRLLIQWQFAALSHRQIDECQLSVGNGQPHFDLIGGIEGGDDSSPADKLTDVDGFLAHEAGKGCLDFGAGEVTAGLCKSRVRILQCGFLHPISAQLIFDLALGWPAVGLRGSSVADIRTGRARIPLRRAIECRLRAFKRRSGSRCLRVAAALRRFRSSRR